jgi:hypothetical protein
VIERTLGFRDYVGDYQRQLFLMDHAGLPLKTVLKQLDLLGEPRSSPCCARSSPRCAGPAVPEAPTHGAPDSGGPRMTRSIAVISAGLSNPSSTRLLADQLATATDVALRGHGDAADPQHRAP